MVGEPVVERGGRERPHDGLAGEVEVGRPELADSVDAAPHAGHEGARTAADSAAAAEAAAASAAESARTSALQYGEEISRTTVGTETVVTVRRLNADGTNVTGVEGVLELTFNAAGTQISALAVGTP